MVATGYFVLLAVMETIWAAELLAFITLILQETRPVACARLFDASAERVALAGGRVPFLLRRFGAVAPLLELLLNIDIESVFGIWPTGVTYALDNLVLSLVLLFVLSVALATFEPVYRAARMQLHAPLPLLRTLRLVIAAVSALAALLGIASGVGRTYRLNWPQGVFLFYTATCAVRARARFLRTCLNRISVFGQAIAILGWVFAVAKVRSLLSHCAHTAFAASRGCGSDARTRFWGCPRCVHLEAVRVRTPLRVCSSPSPPLFHSHLSCFAQFVVHFGVG